MKGFYVQFRSQGDEKWLTMRSFGASGPVRLREAQLFLIEQITRLDEMDRFEYRIIPSTEDAL